MKKLKLSNFRKKHVIRDEAPARITNETVAEYREQVLAGGRRFKYPHQYLRHKLVINAVLVSVVTLILLSIFGWWQLYSMQNTSNFFYRLTRIVPVPVASVDGRQVRFSDYLMTLSGSKHYLEQTEKLDTASADGKRQLEYIKGQALNDAIASTYAAGLAEKHNITVTDKEVDAVINSSLTTVSGKISKEVYDSSTLSTLGYSPDEYRHIIKASLLRQAVAYEVDESASAAKKAAEKIRKDMPAVGLSKVASELKKKGYDVQVGASGLVPKSNHDGGLTQAAGALKVGAISEFIKSNTGDGYYLVQLASKNDTQLSYNFLRITLTQFSKQLKELEQNNKIQRYISVQKTAEIKRK